MDWAVTVSGFLGVFLWWVWRRWRRTEGIPRGSSGWPFIGETIDFIASGHSSEPVAFMQKRRALYGNVFRSHLLGRPVIVSTDAEVNKAVLLNSGGNFVPFYPRSISLLLGESSILKTNGNVQKKVHGLIGSFLKSPCMKAKISREMEQLIETSMGRWHEGQLVFVQDETRMITFQILVGTLMSVNIDEEIQLLMRDFREFSDGLICLPINLPGTVLHNSLKAKERLSKFVHKIIKEKMNRTEEILPKDVMDVLLNEMNGENDAHLSTDFICGNIIEMMIPGQDSVPMLITIAIKFLSDSPIALKHLVEENMELKRQKAHPGDGYEWIDYMSLEFTQNVISETLRLANIINAIWRKALKNMHINGYLIPKDWCVLASLSSIHMNEENYENPHHFNPWRWQRKDSMGPNNFTPFGGGQRLCPGLELSRLEASIFLHHLVTKFSWAAEEDSLVNFPVVKMRRRMPIRVSPLNPAY